MGYSAQVPSHSGIVVYLDLLGSVGVGVTAALSLASRRATVPRDEAAEPERRVPHDRRDWPGRPSTDPASPTTLERPSRAPRCARTSETSRRGPNAARILSNCGNLPASPLTPSAAGQPVTVESKI